MADGTIKIGLELDTAKAKSQLDEFGNSSKDKLKDAGATGEESFTKFGDVADKAARVAAAGLAVLTGAVVAVGGQALNAYADYEQLVGGVDTLFKKSSGKLQQYAAQAYKTSGMSANTYMEQATSFAASLVSSLGGDTAAAVESANTAMVDMSDNANKMGTDIDRITDAYQGFAKQNYTMLDNLKLGYGGTKTEMERLISDANALKEANGEVANLSIDSFADIVEAIHLVQENMGITGTTAKEAATTIQGSIGMAKAAYENWLVALADPSIDLSAVTAELLESLGAVAQNVLPRIAEIAQGITEALPTVFAGIGDVLAPILSEAVASAWNVAFSGLGIPEIDASAVLDVLNGLIEVIQTLSPLLAGLVASFVALKVINTVLGALEGLSAVLIFMGSPIGIVVTAIGLIVAALVALATNAGGCRDQLQEVWNNIVTAVTGFADSVVQTVQGVVDSIVQFFTVDIPTTCSNLLSSIGSWVTNMVSKATELGTNFVQTITDFFSNLPYNIGFAVGYTLTTVVLWVANMLVQAASVGSQFLQTIISWFLQLPTNIGNFLTQAVNSAINFVSNMAAQATSAGSQFLNNLASFISSVPSRVASSLSGAISSAASFVSSFAAKATSAASQFSSNIISGLSSIPSRVTSIGSQIVQGIANGIRGAASAVTSAITGVVGGAISAAKNFLGIHSPSKLAEREIGHWVPEGVAVGMEKDEKSFKKRAVKVLSLDNISASVRFASPTLGSESRAASALNNIAQTINFYAEVKTPDQTAAVMKDYGMYGLAGSYA